MAGSNTTALPAATAKNILWPYHRPPSPSSPSTSTSGATGFSWCPGKPNRENKRRRTGARSFGSFPDWSLGRERRQRSGLSGAQNRTGTTRCVPHLEPLPYCEPIGFIPQEEQDAIGIAFWRQAPLFLPDTARAALFAGILRSTRSRVSTTKRLGSNRRGATCTVSRGCAWLFRKVRRAGRVKERRRFNFRFQCRLVAISTCPERAMYRSFRLIFGWSTRCVWFEYMYVETTCVKSCCVSPRQNLHLS